MRAGRECNQILERGRDQEGDSYAKRLKKLYDAIDGIKDKAISKDKTLLVAALTKVLEVDENSLFLKDSACVDRAFITNKILDFKSQLDGFLGTLEQLMGEKYPLVLRQSQQGVIFLSKFTPPLPPVPITIAPDVNLQEMNYRGRAPEADKRLEKAFFTWLADRGLERGIYDVYFSHSINTNVLPAIFQNKDPSLSKDENTSLFNRGDLVLFCSPIYSMLPANAEQRGLKTAAIMGESKNGYKPDPANIQKALEQNPDARALMIVNPANPTGTCLTREEIDAIGSVIGTHNEKRKNEGKRPLIVIADQTFQDMQWSPIPYDYRLNPHVVSGRRPNMFNNQEFIEYTPFVPIAANSQLRDCAISIGSLSKSVGPGVGIAFWYGNPDLMTPTRPTDGLEPAAKGYAATFFEATCQMVKERNSLGSDNSNPHRQKLFFDLNDAATPADSTQNLSEELHPTPVDNHRAKIHMPAVMRRMVERYEQNYQTLCGKLESINKKLKEEFGADKEYITWTKPDAGFHVAVSFAGLRGMFHQEKDMQLDFGNPRILKTSKDLASELLHQQKVVAYPGEMFAMNGEDMVLRISLNLISTSKDGYGESKFFEGLDRIENFCLSLTKSRMIGRSNGGYGPMP